MSKPISLWQPVERDGERLFERPDPGPFGDHFAVRKTLRQEKSTARRLCFFGESVAAGYLYAPHLTPAGVLETHLRALTGPDSWEVIDLARTNETLESLAATVEASLQLQPDLLVIFAGNNWTLLETPELSPYIPSATARRELAKVLRESGLEGAARLARERLARRADAVLSRIAATGVPALLVIPEVDLESWETRQPVAWLPGDRTARWWEIHDRALRELGGEDWAAAEASAWAMIDLDGGFCPTPFRLLARALAGQGKSEEARDARLSEIDATHYPLLAFLAAPQAGTLPHEILRRGAGLYGLDAVDLREVFPREGMFLDYCHLSSEGIHLAMAAVAAKILAADSTPLSPPKVLPEVEATARFGAAIHTAHRLLANGPIAPLLERWCRSALEASPGIAETMRDFAAVRLAPLPAVLTAEQQRNLASPYRLLLQHGWRWDFLDAEVIAAICQALGLPEPSLELPEEGLDLVHPPRYLAEPLARFYPEAMGHADLNGRAYYRSPWPSSSFLLPGEGAREVRATLRLPGRSGRVRVELNGRACGEIAATERWSRAELSLPGEGFRAGFNRLTLRWPPLAQDGNEALETALCRLEAGLEADLHPVFGEVFSLRVIKARRESPGDPPGSGLRS